MSRSSTSRFPPGFPTQAGRQLSGTCRSTRPHSQLRSTNSSVWAPPLPLISNAATGTGRRRKAVSSRSAHRRRSKSPSTPSGGRRGLIEPCRLGHHLDRLGLAGADAERIGAGVFPDAIALLDAGGWADQRLHVDPFIGDGGDRLVLVLGEV